MFCVFATLQVCWLLFMRWYLGTSSGFDPVFTHFCPWQLFCLFPLIYAIKSSLDSVEKTTDCSSNCRWNSFCFSLLRSLWVALWCVARSLAKIGVAPGHLVFNELCNRALCQRSRKGFWESRLAFCWQAADRYRHCSASNAWHHSASYLAF